MPRWLKIVLVCIGILLIAVYFLLQSLLKPTAENLLKQTLQEQGFTVSAIKVTSLSLTRLAVENLVLGPEGTLWIPNLTVAINPFSPRTGLFENITLEGVRLRLVLEDGVWRAPGLEQALKGKEKTQPVQYGIPILPIREAILKDFELELKLPKKTAKLKAQGQFNFDGKQMNIKAAARLVEGCVAPTSEELCATFETIDLSYKAAAMHEGNSRVYLAGKLDGKLVRFALPAKNIAAETITLNGDVHYGEKLETDLVLKAAAIAMPQLPSLMLHSTLKLDNQLLAINASVNDAAKKFTAELQGEHHLQKKTGKITLKPLKLTFEPSALQPADIIKNMPDTLTDVNGTLELTGTMRWSQTATGMDAKADLDFTQLIMNEMVIKGVKSSMRFTGLPLQNTGPQVISVEKIETTPPLDHAKLMFQFRPDGTVNLQRAEANLNDGLITLGPAIVNMAQPLPISFTIELSRVAIEPLLTIALKEGVAATGAVSGKIPVSIDKDGKVQMHDGIIAALTTGTLSYKPKDAPAEGSEISILYKALEDFHYKSFSAKVVSDKPDALEIHLDMLGSNPKLYDGKPIELHIKLQGDLLNIVKSGLNLYALPKTIEKQLDAPNP